MPVCACTCDGRKKSSFAAHSALCPDVLETIRLETLFYATCPVTSLTSIFRISTVLEHNKSLFWESCNGHFAKFQLISEGGDFPVDVQ